MQSKTSPSLLDKISLFTIAFHTAFLASSAATTQFYSPKFRLTMCAEVGYHASEVRRERLEATVERVGDQMNFVSVYRRFSFYCLFGRASSCRF